MQVTGYQRNCSAISLIDADALRSIMAKGLGISYILFPVGILLVFLAIFLTATLILFRRDIE